MKAPSQKNTMTKFRGELWEFLRLSELPRTTGLGPWLAENRPRTEQHVQEVVAALEALGPKGAKRVSRVVKDVLATLYPSHRLRSPSPGAAGSYQEEQWIPLPHVSLPPYGCQLREASKEIRFWFPDYSRGSGSGKGLRVVECKAFKKRDWVRIGLEHGEEEVGAVAVEIARRLSEVDVKAPVAQLEAHLASITQDVWMPRGFFRDAGGVFATSFLIQGRGLGGEERHVGLAVCEQLGALVDTLVDPWREAYRAIPIQRKRRIYRTFDERQEGYAARIPKKVRMAAQVERPETRPELGWLEEVPEEVPSWTTVRLVQGDNLDSLRLLSEEGRERVRGVYADPPYNTGNSSVYIYRDRFVASGWERFLEERVRGVQGVLEKGGWFALSVDDNATHHARVVLDKCFKLVNFVGTLTWRKKVVRGRGAKHLLPQTEYIHFYGNPKAQLPDFSEPLTDDMRAAYTLSDEDGPYKRIPLAKTGTSQSPRPNLFYDIEAPDGEKIPCPTQQWRWSRETLAARRDEIEFVRGRDGRWRVYTKQRLHLKEGERRRTPVSYYDRATTSHGTKEIKDRFGSVVADFPKPLQLLRDVLEWTEGGVCEGPSTYLDPFAGSGSTGEAVLQKVREDGVARRVVLLEQGGHFDTVLVPRIFKAVLSESWSKGAPLGPGLSNVQVVVEYLESFDERVERLRQGP